MNLGGNFEVVTEGVTELKLEKKWYYNDLLHPLKGCMVEISCSDLSCCPKACISRQSRRHVNFRLLRENESSTMSFSSFLYSHVTILE